jgi:hypothetical protein
MSTHEGIHAMPAEQFEGVTSNELIQMLVDLQDELEQYAGLLTAECNLSDAEVVALINREKPIHPAKDPLGHSDNLLRVVKRMREVNEGIIRVTVREIPKPATVATVVDVEL